MRSGRKNNGIVVHDSAPTTKAVSVCVAVCSHFVISVTVFPMFVLLFRLSFHVRSLHPCVTGVGSKSCRRFRYIIRPVVCRWLVRI